MAPLSTGIARALGSLSIYAYNHCRGWYVAEVQRNGRRDVPASREGDGGGESIEGGAGPEGADTC